MRPGKPIVLPLLLLALASLPLLAWAGSAPPPDPAPGSAVAWWVWPILLFFCCLLIGIVASMGGVGGGVLFVPIVSAFFPFHLDFVRGASLVMALAGALSASPHLLRSGMANLRLTMPLSLMASISSILGARIGLMMPERLAQSALGVLILGIALLMLLARRSDFPVVSEPGWLASRLKMEGTYHEATLGKDIPWRVRRAGLGLVLFFGIGFISGLFGLGAGWANVPVLNLVMGAPVKVSVASSMVILAMSNTSAAWIYLHQGAVLALIAVPAVLGVTLGSPIGVRLLTVVKPGVVRRMVMLILFLSGARSLLKGLALWN